MFCVEEHKWGYFTHIYRCAYSTRIYRYAGDASSLGGMHPHLGATRPRVGIVKLGVDAPTWQ